MKAKKESKSSNISKVKEDVAKNPTKPCTVLDDYNCFTVSEKRIHTVNGLKEFMKQVIKEIQDDPKVYTITKFLTKHGIPRQTYYDWVAKFDFMKEYHDILLTICGDRHVEAVAEDFRYIHVVQPIYDEYIYAKGVKFHSDLKKQEDNKNVPVTVYLDGVKVTGEVKPKEGKDNDELV